MPAIVFSLVDQLRDRGLGVTLAIGSGKVRDGVVALPSFSKRPADVARFALALRSLLRESRSDVVHGHGLRLAPALRLATAFGPRVSTVVTCHGLPPDQVAGAARAIRLSGVLVASCGEGPRALLEAHGIHGPLLRNGVSDPPPPADRKTVMREWGLPAKHRLVLSVGRLVPQKDHLTAIRTIKHLPDTALVIVGTGPLQSELQKVTESLGLTSRVRLVGYRSDARALIGAADALLIPSRWEGHPLVALEAMAASVPVVAASSPGLREWLIHGENGLLAMVGDDKYLADCLVCLFEDKELRARVVAGGAQVANRHTLTTVVDEHLDFYESLVRQVRRRGTRRHASTPAAGA